MKKIDAAMGRLSAALAMLAALCTVAMMFTMVADVGNRLIGGGSLAGAYEMASMLVVMVVFLGFAYAERTETNVRITLATSRMPHAVARVARLVGGVVSLAIVALFTRSTWDQALVSLERNEFTQGLVDFPIWPTKFVVAAGFTALTIECVLGIWRRWTAQTEAEVHPDAPAGAHL